MSDDLMLDVSLAHELKLAFRRCGYTAANIKRLTEGHILSDFRRVLVGTAHVELKECVMPLDEAPILIPDDAEVIEHHTAEAMEWDPNRFEFWYTQNQIKEQRITGPKLREEMRRSGNTPLNANALDFLLANEECIPQEWKQRNVFFWGTIYRDKPQEMLFVRYLLWIDGEWNWSCREVSEHFRSTGWRSKGSPALVYAK